jgi:hypothetical protein
MKLDAVDEVVMLRTKLRYIDSEITNHNDPRQIEHCKVIFASSATGTGYGGLTPSEHVKVAILALVIADLMNQRKAVIARLCELGIEVTE